MDAATHNFYEFINSRNTHKGPYRFNNDTDFDALVLLELDELEKLSEKYKTALGTLSKCIRQYLWRDGEHGNSHRLYFVLNKINQVMCCFTKLLSEEYFWSLDTVIEYVTLLHQTKANYDIDINDQIYEDIIDKIAIADAKEIIELRWQDVYSAPDSHKAFMDVFDDVFTNAFEKYEALFFHQMSETDVLCRMVRQADCDESRFIPLPQCTSQNRWNPPGRSFLYMSFGEEEHPYNEKLTLEEYICLLEHKLDCDTECAFCRFTPKQPGHVLDLSYNDRKLKSFRQIIEREVHSISQKGFQYLLSDPDVYLHRDDNQYIISRIEGFVEASPISDQSLTESIAKQYLKLVCCSIYKKVDGTEAEKEEAYKSFHILAKYLESKGVTGIIYPCTRAIK